MTSALIRKARRLIEDPVLRRWAVSAALGRAGPKAAFESHRPPYLSDVTLAEARRETLSPGCADTFRPLGAGAPKAPLVLALPGETLELTPGEERRFFERRFTDTETQLAAYRFAWLPIAGDDVDPAWVAVLWQAFSERFAEPDTSWAWHPYTAAERAINILDYALRCGLPGERARTLALIARHAGAIAERLEYHGDHDTSNHLANNGRGLYRIGLALGMQTAIEIGKRILLAEAERIFRRSGILREGSTHYHLLLTRNYADAFLAAEAHRRPEADALREIVRRALAVLPPLVLPGGLPLVGDVSPDCPPDFLSSLLPGGSFTSGWAALLSAPARESLNALCRDLPTASSDQLAADGWVRLTRNRWSMLWHVAPDGWPSMPGHAHQDMGSFEAHWDKTPLFIDPGRGAYGESAEAALFVSAVAHNSLTVDDQDPYPPNKPYYGEAFRRAVCGPPPRLRRGSDGVTVAFHGFSRLSGIGEAERAFRIHEDALEIVDTVQGKGRHTLARHLHTPWPAHETNGGVTIRTPSGVFRIDADAPLTITMGKHWIAYGMAKPSWVIRATTPAMLPARLHLRVQPL